MVARVTGAVVGAASYDAYGKSTTTGATTPLGFAGQYTDSETGFQYLRARYYDPVTGQFLTRDPIESITQEPYAYAHNNPINYVDPTGLVGFEIGPVKVGDGCPLGKNPNGSCRGSGVAKSAAAQTVKTGSNAVSTGGSAVSAVAATTAVAIPVTAPVALPIAGGAQAVSAVSGGVATVIECADGGPVFDCAAGLAATAIPGVSAGVLRQLGRRYGDDVARVGNAALADLDFSASTAGLARDLWC